MEKWYYYRLTRIWMMRNPFKGMSLVAVIAFCAGGGVFVFLDQYEWGKAILDTIYMMISFEATTATMVANDKPFWNIILLIVIADTCNIILDIFIVKWILSWKFAKTKIDWISFQAKKIWQKIKAFFKHQFRWIHGGNASNILSIDISNYFDNWIEHINGYKKNPTKAGIGAIFILAVIPRIPFLIVGGVSIAIFIIRYNKYGYKAWLVLFFGIILRTAVWLSSMYGLISLF